MAKKITKQDTPFFAEIAALLAASRARAYRAVNTVMVETYWKIGARIVKEEQKGAERADYGTRLIENLSRYLGDRFGKGFSEANLQNMRLFYMTFPQFPTQRVGNLSWTHLRIIMRLDNEKERNYYLREASSENWSYRVLERNIKTGYYRRILSSQDTGKRLKALDDIAPNITDFIKDPYVLEFLNVPEDLKGKESLLESALINSLQKFLLELGKGFSFVARQQRMSLEDEHFYADLVFYNYLLKCFVIIDLKTTKLTHADIGQMDMYVRMFDNLKRGDGDNPTIGIVLCASKSAVMVRYSVLQESRQLFASTYQTILPTEEELADMIRQHQICMEREETP